MWELDHKKAECWRIDAFELWCWRRFLKVPWTARRSNQSILKEINPEYSLEGLMLKLKLQYFGHLMPRVNSLEKALMLGKIEGRRRRGWHGWIASPTQWKRIWASSERWWRTWKPGMLCCKELNATENWTTTTSLVSPVEARRKASPRLLLLLEHNLVLPPGPYPDEGPCILEKWK